MRPLVIDTETNIGGPLDVYTFIFGTNPDNIYILHSSEGFSKRLPSGILDNVDILVGHNLVFDLGILINDNQLRSFVLKGGIIWDTQYAEYLLSGQRHTFASLAELQEIYLGEKQKPSRISYLFGKGIGADRILTKREQCPKLFSLYETYCQSDGRSTLQVFSNQWRIAKSKNMLPIIKIYMKFLMSLIYIQNTGINLDMVKLEKTYNEFKIKEIELIEKAQESVKVLWNIHPSIPELNIGSGRINSLLLFGGEIDCVVRRHIGQYKNGNDKFKNEIDTVKIRGFGLPTNITTKLKTGWYKVDDAVLMKAKSISKNPLVVTYCDLKLEAMNYRKIANTYLKAFIEKSRSGKLYPKLNHCKVITGRLSSEDPNMQNLPSSGEMAIAVEGQLIAPPGYTCVSMDYNALEMWVAAYLSSDTRLLDDLINLDIHCVTVGYFKPEYSYEEIYDLCKVQKDPEWDDLRFKAKGIRYGREYGRSTRALASDTGLSEDQVKTIFEREDTRYPNKALYNKQMIEFVRQHKELSLRKHFPAYLCKPSKNGKQFRGEVELLPIDLPSGERQFKQDECRHYGWYQTKTGRKYTFEEYGNVYKGQLKRTIKPTQIMNYKSQGTANDIIASAMAEILGYQLRSNDEFKMILTIHDSIRYYIKNDKLDLHIPKLCGIMSKASYLPVPLDFEIPIDVKIGPNFGDMKEYRL